MKILLATPIHSSKDYSLERWAKSVQATELPVFLVDNSPEPYIERLKSVLPKAEIAHIDVPDDDPEIRVGKARNVIREKILREGWDYWLCWESDTVAPPEIIDIMLSYKVPVVHHSFPSRHTDEIDTWFGISLIHRDILEKYPFEWGEIDQEMPGVWHGIDSWFNRRVLRGGDKMIELYNMVPTEHYG